MANNNSKKFEILLISVIAARSTSFVFSKMILQGMGTFNLLAIRFLLAFAILSIIFCKRLAKIDKRIIKAGLASGVSYFFVMACELKALSMTDSSVVALMENSAIVLVPLFESVLKRRLPTKMTVVCAILAMGGVICLFVQNGSITGGMLFAILSAILYAIAIIVIDRSVTGVDDTLSVGIIEVGTLGAMALVASLATEDFHLSAPAAHWGMIIYLVVVCTGFGFTLQPVAQRHVSSERTGLFCAVEPAVATLLGAVVLNEKLGVFSIIGLLLIVLCIILPYIKINKNNESASPHCQ